MKVWNEYGTEHSSNLVMIGHFKELRDAEMTHQIIERIIGQVQAEADAYRYDADPQDRRFSDAMLDLLRASNLYSLGPAELEQFAYDANVSVEGNQIVVTTEEADVSAFLKIMIDKGARVEVYSAHDYPGTGKGRGG